MTNRKHFLAFRSVQVHARQAGLARAHSAVMFAVLLVQASHVATTHWASAVLELQRADNAATPNGKLAALISTVRAIYACVRLGGPCRAMPDT